MLLVTLQTLILTDLSGLGSSAKGTRLRSRKEFDVVLVSVKERRTTSKILESFLQSHSKLFKDIESTYRGFTCKCKGYDVDFLPAVDKIDVLSPTTCLHEKRDRLCSCILRKHPVKKLNSTTFAALKETDMHREFSSLVAVLSAQLFQEQVHPSTKDAILLLKFIVRAAFPPGEKLHRYGAQNAVPPSFLLEYLILHPLKCLYELQQPHSTRTNRTDWLGYEISPHLLFCCACFEVARVGSIQQNWDHGQYLSYSSSDSYLTNYFNPLEDVLLRVSNWKPCRDFALTLLKQYYQLEPYELSGILLILSFS